MASSSETYLQTVSAELSRYESLLGRFEKAWKEGRRPAIEDYLAEAQAAPLPVLGELVHVELVPKIRIRLA